MNLKEILLDSLLILPISYSGDYLEELKIKLKSYKNLINSYSNDSFKINKKKLYKDINEICESIINIITYYLEGYQHKSFQEIDKILKKFKDFLLNDLYSLHFIIPNYGFYRIRAFDKKEKKICCNALFHIPYEDYTKVNNFRFSIQGHPCLYLSSSLYVCLQEVNKKKTENFCISRYETWNGAVPLKILHLAIDPKYLYKYLLLNENNNWYSDVLKTFFRIYPFMIASYFKVQYEKRPFKPEYIISQMLTEWTRSNNDINAICYFSTKIKKNTISPILNLNYAFPLPSKSNYDNSFKDLFQISKPVIFRKKIIEDEYKKNRNDIKGFINKNNVKTKNDQSERIIKYANKQINYWKSHWGKLERLLQYSKVYSVRDHDNFFKKKIIEVWEFDKNKGASFK